MENIEDNLRKYLEDLARLNNRHGFWLQEHGRDGLWVDRIPEGQSIGYHAYFPQTASESSGGLESCAKVFRVLGEEDP